MELKDAMAENERLRAQIAELTAPPEPKVKEPTKEEKALVAEGCKLYGIQEQYVLSSNVRDGVAVIVTVGGAKVQFSRSMDLKKIVPLEAVRIDGIIRKKMKPVTMGKK